jgi:outer membrane protein OmpA-like peptidoglycan-associated protein
VDDGRSGTADCSVALNVRAPEPSPEFVELENRLALHSIYFPTGRPTATNPTAEFVQSQQGILLSLASDFNRYLATKPQSHLILEGHADRRGSDEYNNQLTERRVERTRRFLIEHGVPSANIETRSLGKQENLDLEQVRQLIDQNPDLSNADRRELESNLQTIVWANNRRVDISLNTTGQQSTRLYPFNAKDSMTLLSAKGTEAKARTTTPGVKRPGIKKTSAKP